MNKPILPTLDAGVCQFDARQRLLQAILDIFAENWKFADVVHACCWAQRELASLPTVRDVVTLQGWIVGKADAPHT